MKERSNRPVSVLIIDDDPRMAKPLKVAFETYNRGELPLPNHIRTLGFGSVTFETELCGSAEEAMRKLQGMAGQWDVFVIDRKFLGEIKDILLLESLRDLRVQGIRIVWTAFPEVEAEGDRFTPNIVQCMRLGAWDYLNKLRARYGDTFTDVIVSSIEGWAARQREIRRAEADVEPSRFVTEHFKELYNEYKGQFVAFSRDPTNAWKPLVAHPSLYGLYRDPEVASRDRATLHIAMIREVGDDRKTQETHESDR